MHITKTRQQLDVLFLCLYCERVYADVFAFQDERKFRCIAETFGDVDNILARSAEAGVDDEH